MLTFESTQISNRLYSTKVFHNGTHIATVNLTTMEPTTRTRLLVDVIGCDNYIASNTVSGKRIASVMVEKDA